MVVKTKLISNHPKNLTENSFSFKRKSFHSTEPVTVSELKRRNKLNCLLFYLLLILCACHIWAIQISAAVKGMVFKQFTLV